MDAQLNELSSAAAESLSEEHVVQYYSAWGHHWHLQSFWTARGLRGDQCISKGQVCEQNLDVHRSVAQSKDRSSQGRLQPGGPFESRWKDVHNEGLSFDARRYHQIEPHEGCMWALAAAPQAFCRITNAHAADLLSLNFPLPTNTFTSSCSDAHPPAG